MEIQGRIWIKNEDKSILGNGKIELLERISKSGSIAKAAKEMGMSYKAAWDSIDIMNKSSKKPLVTSVTGGKGGGGTQVTKEGQEAIKIFHTIQEAQEKLFELFQEDLQKWNEHSNLSNSLFKNQFLGTILAIKEENPYAEITLEIAPKLQIITITPLSSLQKYHLKVGMQAYILINANQIIVFKDKPTNLSLRNCIEGKICHINKEGINCEIIIENQKISLSAIITESSSKHLSLEIGQKVWFGFKANNIILSV